MQQDKQWLLVFNFKSFSAIKGSMTYLQALQISMKFLLQMVSKYFRGLLNALHLKGKFSSGIEGASSINIKSRFYWKQLSETILCICLLMFLKFIWVTLIQKQQKYK